MLNISDQRTTAYVIGVALGDGNLSNPNGRAVRLRITCDCKYPHLISKIEKSIKKIAPANRVTRVRKKGNCIDISCYSNDWEKVLGWKAKGGSKFKQNVSIPKWILLKKEYCRACLCGLVETDGSVYFDRGYLTVNFTTQIPNIAKSFEILTDILGYKPSVCKIKQPEKQLRLTFRIHKRASDFIRELNIEKR